MVRQNSEGGLNLTVDGQSRPDFLKCCDDLDISIKKFKVYLKPFEVPNFRMKP